MTGHVEECRTASEEVRTPGAAEAGTEAAASSRPASGTDALSKDGPEGEGASAPPRADPAAARRQADILVRAVAAATARSIAASLRARRARPVENGMSGAASAVPSLDYRAATPGQREALKRRIRAAAARGEKVYPM